jgi:hypothetical protein
MAGIVSKIAKRVEERSRTIWNCFQTPFLVSLFTISLKTTFPTASISVRSSRIALISFGNPHTSTGNTHPCRLRILTLVKSRCPVSAL